MSETIDRQKSGCTRVVDLTYERALEKVK